MITPTFPTPDQIQEAITKVTEKLSIKQINQSKNFPVKEGLTDCLRLLNDRIQNPENPYFKGENNEEFEMSDAIYRSQLQDIKKLKTQQGRAIAILCVDWLNGNEKAVSFLDTEIKMR